MEQLKENTEYSFRVSAFNKMGQSAYKQTSSMVKTKKKQRAPKVLAVSLIVSFCFIENTSKQLVKTAMLQ